MILSVQVSGVEGSRGFHWVACFSPGLGELVTKSVTNRAAGGTSTPREEGEHFKARQSGDLRTAGAQGSSPSL